jgi:hypothetical protein
VEWESPRVVTTWEAGPFTHPVEISRPEVEVRAGRSSAYRVGDVTHVVEGPWQVVIRNLGLNASREVIGRWEIHHSWSVQGGVAFRPDAGRFAPGAGASERSWSSGSEVRLGGASERWRIGGSEISWRGASERMLAGASQWSYGGASERVHLGASERRLGGASERAFSGGSEGRLGGGSSSLPFPDVDAAKDAED